MRTLKERITAFGGCTKVSRAMTAIGVKVTPQMVNGWIVRGRVPEEKVWAFCEATGILPADLRPDIFPPPEEYWMRTRRILDKRLLPEGN